MNRIFDFEKPCKRTHSFYYPFLNTQCSLFPACRPTVNTSRNSLFRNFKTFTDTESNSTFFSSILPTACCSSKGGNPHFYSNKTADMNKEDMLPGSLVPPSGKQISYSNEINKWLEKETGFDRLKIMFAVNETGFIQQDVQEMNAILRRSIIIGIFYGAVSAALEVNKRKTEQSSSKSEAVLKGITKEVLGGKYIFKETMKTTLQIATLALSFVHLSQAIAAYRNQSSVWEYTTSTAVGLGLISLGRPLKSVLMSTATGAAIGTVGGFAACYILNNAGLNQEQRHRERILSFLTHEKPRHKPSM